MKKFATRLEDLVLENLPENLVLQNARYVRDARNEKMSDETIRQSLLAVGWTTDDVDAAFAKAGSL